jgi:hypothetical protein
MIDALGQSVIRPALFVEMHFISEVVRVWNGLGTINWNGQSWLGVGSLGSISTIEEGATVEAKGITLTCSGLDPTLLNDTLENYQVGLPVTVWFGLFDASGALIPDPILSFAGRMDQPSLSVDGQTATISINCESKLLDMNVSCETYLTNEWQRVEFSGDRGLEYVNSLQERQINWGRSPSSQNNR